MSEKKAFSPLPASPAASAASAAAMGPPHLPLMHLHRRPRAMS